MFPLFPQKRIAPEQRHVHARCHHGRSETRDVHLSLPDNNTITLSKKGEQGEHSPDFRTMTRKTLFPLLFPLFPLLPDSVT